MTSRERLLTVLNHKIPDRVPVSFYDMTGWYCDPFESKRSPAEKSLRNVFSTFLTGWWNQEPSYMPLMEYIRQKADCLFMTEIPTSNAYLQKNTHVTQWKEGISTFTKIITTTPKGDLTQIYRMDANVYTAWQIEHKIKDEKDIEKFLSIPFEPLPVDVSHIKTQDQFIGDNGILMIDIADPICTVMDLFNFEDFSILAVAEQDTILRMLNKVFEEKKHFLKEMLQKGAGPLFRVFGPECCTPPFFPHEYFRKYVVDFDKPLIDLIHQHGQLVRLHSHGKIKTVLRDILEMEVDALDPVEAPPSGDITLAEVKAACGGKVCLFGNIQLHDLEQLSATQMRKVVEQCVREGKPDGNFVALPTATPINVPLSPRTEENLRIFLDTVLELGQY